VVNEAVGARNQPVQRHEFTRAIAARLPAPGALPRNLMEHTNFYNP